METQRTYRILTVEDDPSVAQGLVESLSTEGFDVHCEATAAAGIEWALNCSPHLIILDVRLPDGSGFDVLRQLRARGLRQPILMLTVQAEEIDRVLGLELGADDYLVKPFLIRELLARVRALLRRAYGALSSAEAELLYVDDLLVDLTRACVSRDGADLRLTPTEYRLLVHMTRRAGQVFSREQLLRAIWGDDGEFHDENTVSVHIRRLREKVEHDPSNPQIVLTVPSLGYRVAG